MPLQRKGVDGILDGQVACLEGFEPPTRGLEGRRSSPAELQAAVLVYPSRSLSKYLTAAPDRWPPIDRGAQI